MFLHVLNWINNENNVFLHVWNWVEVYDNFACVKNIFFLCKTDWHFFQFFKIIFYEKLFSSLITCKIYMFFIWEDNIWKEKLVFAF